MDTHKIRMMMPYPRARDHLKMIGKTEQMWWKSYTPMSIGCNEFEGHIEVVAQVQEKTTGNIYKHEIIVPENYQLSEKQRNITIQGQWEEARKKLYYVLELRQEELQSKKKKIGACASSSSNG